MICASANLQADKNEPVLSVRIQKKKTIVITIVFFFLVDVNGLEPLTLRTSSECSTN